MVGVGVWGARKKLGRNVNILRRPRLSARNNDAAEDQINAIFYSHAKQQLRRGRFLLQTITAMAARRACTALSIRAFRSILQPCRHGSSSTSAMAYKAIHRRIAPLPAIDTRSSSPKSYQFNAELLTTFQLSGLQLKLFPAFCTKRPYPVRTRRRDTSLIAWCRTSPVF